MDRHYIGSVTATTHQEKGIITLESNPSRGTVLPAPHGKGNKCDKNVKYKRTDANDLCLFNNGSNTFLYSGNGTYSAIDLSFASPTLFDRFSREVHDYCCGSDHFPIILRTLENDNHVKQQRWKFKQADWSTFKALSSLQLNKRTFQSADPVTDFSNILLDIAEQTIPKSSISSKPRKPWFDDECKQVIKERRKSEKAFKQSPCHSKLSSFRIHRAKASRTI